MSFERRNLVLLYAGLATAALVVVARTASSASPSAPQVAATVGRCDTRIPIANLPYLITTPGSYYVTRELVGTSGYGIGISSDDVTLDLNGYTVRGAGGSEGIVVFDPQQDVTIENGIVRGWSANGINAGNVTSGRLQGLVAEGNGVSGIVAGINCTVLDCNASSNGSAGIQARSGSTIVNCTARSNVFGILSLLPAQGMLIQNCTATANTDDGIVLSGTSGCTLLENQCWANADRGILIDNGTANRVDSNHCVSNAVGIEVKGVSSSDNVVVRNTCRVNGSGNYSFAAGADAGPVGTAATATSPWANL